MTEAASRKNHRHVRGGVLVGIAEVAAIEQHAAVEQRLAAFLNAFEIPEQLRQQFHMRPVDGVELFQLAFVAAVMGEIVISIGDLNAFYIDGR